MGNSQFGEQEKIPAGGIEFDNRLGEERDEGGNTFQTNNCDNTCMSMLFFCSFSSISRYVWN